MSTLPEEVFMCRDIRYGPPPVDLGAQRQAFRSLAESIRERARAVALGGNPDAIILPWFFREEDEQEDTADP